MFENFHKQNLLFQSSKYKLFSYLKILCMYSVILQDKQLDSNCFAHSARTPPAVRPGMMICGGEGGAPPPILLD